MTKTRHSFRARILKVGINPCVRVPFRITKNLAAIKGYIPVKGTMDRFSSQQTLCPVKNSNYRLYVNGIMLKGSGKRLHDIATFVIAQDDKPKTTTPRMLPVFRKALTVNNLSPAFEKLIPSRRKEILKYMNGLKTDLSRQRNINKVIAELASRRS